MTNSFISYAQNGVDVVLWRALQHVDAGVYVDVGAADPVGYSVSYAMYQRGWSGINLEPEPKFAEALRLIRPRDITLEVAAGDSVGELTLYHPRGTGLSTVDATGADRLKSAGFDLEEVRVPERPLNSILSDHLDSTDPIHFLKIDVEGSEHRVLRGLDLTVWRPWIIVVEATAPMSTERTHEEWDPYLVKHGYTCTLFDGLNRFYLADEHPELAEHLDHGVCVFDGSVQTAVETLAIARHREDMVESLYRAKERIAQLETEAADGANELEQVRSELRLANDRVATSRGEVAALQEQADAQDARLRELEECRRQLQEDADLKAGERAVVDDRLRSAERELEALREYAALKDRERAIVDDQVRVLSSDLALVHTSQSWRAGRALTRVAGASGLTSVVRSARRRPWVGRVSAAARSRVHADEVQEVAGSAPQSGAWAFPTQKTWSGELASFAHHLWGPELHSNERILEMVGRLDIDREDELLNQRFSAEERRSVYDLQLALSGRSYRPVGTSGLLIDGRCLSDPRFVGRGVGRHAANVLQDIMNGLDGGVSVWFLGADEGLATLDERLRSRIRVISPTSSMSEIPSASSFVSLAPATDAPSPQWIARTADASAVVYDLIPWQFGSHYFPSAVSFVDHVASLVWLRSFDELWAISQSTADHASEVLGIDPQRIRVTGVESPIGFAASGTVVGVVDDDLDDDVVRIALCGGGDARKNLLTPILGVRSTPGISTKIEVIGVLPEEMADELREAGSHSSRHLVEILGPMSDTEVAGAYRRAHLVVVPSYAEGFSLPVSEGVESGRPVLASDIPAHAELLGDGPWLVEADSPEAWMRGVERFVQNGASWSERQQEHLTACRGARWSAGRRHFSFDVTSRPVRREGRRPRLAICTPLPDQSSGIADYSVHTLAPLDRVFDVTLVTNDYRDIRTDQFAPVRDTTFCTSIDGDYDFVLNVVGNSHFHIPTLAHLERFGGAVLSHDNRMTDVYAHWRGDDFVARLLSQGPQDVPVEQIPSLRINPDDLPNLGYAELAANADPLMVHSQALADRVAEETGVKPVVLPFCPYRLPPPDFRRAARSNSVITVGSFGAVSSVFKRHDLIIEAMGWLTQWGHDVRLVFVGDATATEARLVDSLAESVGFRDRMTITGRVDDAEYRHWLTEVDVAIQVRNSALLTLSGAIVDAIGYGVPVVASEAAKLVVDGAPNVTAIPNEFSSYHLASGVERALELDDDSEDRRRAFLEERSPENYSRLLAEALLESEATS